MPGQIAAHLAYDSGDFYDEAFDEHNAPRPAYTSVVADLANRDLDALARRTRELLAECGVAFGGADGHPFVVDPVPRIITVEEWEGLAAGLKQRVRALDAFLDDAYGDQRAVAEGIVSGHVMAGSTYFEKDLVGVRPAGGARIGLAGLDLVRDADGGSGCWKTTCGRRQGSRTPWPPPTRSPRSSGSTARASGPGPSSAVRCDG